MKKISAIQNPDGTYRVTIQDEYTTYDSNNGATVENRCVSTTDIDCPFNKRDSRTGEDYCKCVTTVYQCEYFKMGRDPYYCNWLVEN